MVKVPQRQTVYADYLYRKVDELLVKRGGFTLESLAEFAGLKVTGNMRRRIQHCIVEGTLYVVPAYTKEKGTVMVYYRQIEKLNARNPF